MKRVSLFVFLFACILLPATGQAAYPRVLMQTNFGDIMIELRNDKAPVTCENFLQYVRTGYYDYLLFHRVEAAFVIQGGGYFLAGGNLYEAPTNPPIINESYNNLSNLRGTIAMARTSDPNSAASEFYINLVDNTFLDRKSATDVGYCVFGNIISGMNVVDAIAQTPVTTKYGLANFPYPTPVVIISAKLITPGCWLNSDINNDGIADFKDYALLAANWQKTGVNLLGDLSQNNVVNADDLRLFSGNWLGAAAWYKPIPEDINGDGIVNFKDFAKIAANWQKLGTAYYGDLNNDWFIDFNDLSLLADHWLAD